MEYIYNSPMGELLIVYDDSHILGLYFNKCQTKEYQKNNIIDECVGQLDAYFAGKLREFDLPLNPIGTEFRRVVWTALQTIPYGETLSYGGLAAKIGKPSASRAVGGANNKNPISIIIPCHRVIGADGAMVGYGGGLENKIWLLEHEKRHYDETKMS